VMAFLKSGDFESMVNTLMYTCVYIFASAQVLNALYRKFRLTMLSIVTQGHGKIGRAITDATDPGTATTRFVNLINQHVDRT
jgi:phage terminase Nu1 subunit (DNA packaging protein)